MSSKTGHFSTEYNEIFPTFIYTFVLCHRVRMEIFQYSCYASTEYFLRVIKDNISLRFSACVHCVSSFYKFILTSGKYFRKSDSSLTSSIKYEERK